MNHVDPEMLAAWADDALSPTDARAVESHLADCSECRAIAAVFGRTIETPEPAERRMSLAARGAVAVQPHSREGHTALRGWILPLAASIVIAGGVAWKFWPRPEQPKQMAAGAPARTVESAPPIPAPPQTQAPAPPKKSLPAIPPAKAPKTRVVQPTPMPAPLPAVAPPMPAPVASPPPPPILFTPPQGPPAPVVAAGPPPTVNDTMLRANVGAAQAVRAAGSGGGRGGGGAPRPVLITSTAPLLWRIGASNIVERSTDDGATWSIVPIAAEGVQFTFGSAPNANACWLIGRMGAVFISNKGAAFKRLPFPEAIDLTTMIAVDELKATVIARDGRAFSTADGGQTWQVARF